MNENTLGNFRNKHQHEDLVEKSKLEKGPSGGDNLPSGSARKNKNYKSGDDVSTLKKDFRKVSSSTSNDIKSSREAQRSRGDNSKQRPSISSTPANMGSTINDGGALGALSSHEEVAILAKFGAEKKIAWTRLLLQRPDNDDDDQMSKWLMQVMSVSDVKKSPYNKKKRKTYHDDDCNDDRQTSARRRRRRRRKEPSMRRKRDDDDAGNDRPYNTFVETSKSKNNGSSDESTGLSSLEAGETNEDSVDNDDVEYINNKKNDVDHSDSSSSETPVADANDDATERLKEQNHEEEKEERRKDSLPSNRSDGEGGDGDSKDVVDATSRKEIYGSSSSPTDSTNALQHETTDKKAFIDV